MPGTVIVFNFTVAKYDSWVYWVGVTKNMMDKMLLLLELKENSIHSNNIIYLLSHQKTVVVTSKKFIALIYGLLCDHI